MIEAVIELIFEFLGEVLIQTLAEIGLEFGFQSVKIKKPISPIFASFGLLILGGAIGFLSTLLLPEFIIVKKLTGLSLIISPICVGLILHYFGKWKQKQGKNPTYLASFWGGATFAFTMAFTRWFLFHLSL